MQHSFRKVRERCLLRMCFGVRRQQELTITHAMPSTELFFSPKEPCLKEAMPGFSARAVGEQPCTDNVLGTG